MGSSPEINNLKERNYTKHPSMTPLVKFHGHVVKTFSALPPTGKCFEVLKRIALVVVSPLAYLALALIGLLGYPYTVKGKKIASEQNHASIRDGVNQTFIPNEEDRSREATAVRIPAEVMKVADKSSPIVKDKKIALIKNHASTDLVNKAFDDRASSLIEDVKRTMLRSFTDSLWGNNNSSKIKYFVKCQFAGQSQNFEIDILPTDRSIDTSCFNNSINEPLENIKKWFIEKFEIYGLEVKFNISGQAFTLVKNNIGHASWSANANSTRNGSTWFASHSDAIPDKETLLEYLLFERKLLTNQ